MIKRKFVASALNPDVDPRPYENFRGVFTASGLIVYAETADEAHDLVQEWHKLADEYTSLCRRAAALVGGQAHYCCSDRCNCPETIKARKIAIRARLREIEI